ncbi:MAG TPA: hypothetical protein VNP93_07730 [Gaiellaceae bacterium]|nr:hypothetical protein [Gaiellaceae bacterium]
MLMEAASFPRPRRRSTPSWKAGVALVVYAAAVVVAWQLVDGTTAQPADAEPAAVAPPNTGPLAPTSSDLALGTIAARGGRSVVSIGDSAGFIAWTANGLSLIVTARPAGGWQTGPDRSVSVGIGTRELDGKLVRTNRRSGLGLVRVEGDVARPLWQQRQAAPVQKGDTLVAATTAGSAIFVVTESRHTAIWGLRGRPVPGAPVFDESGRLVGVTTTSRVIPIDRACGSIRRC